MRLLDERESIRKYLNTWHKKVYKGYFNIDYEIPVFVNRVQGYKSDVLPCFILMLGDSSSVRTGVIGSAGYRQWTVSYRPPRIDDEIFGLTILEQLEADIMYDKSIPAYTVNYNYPNPMARKNNRLGGDVGIGDYNVVLEGARYSGNDLTVDNYKGFKDAGTIQTTGLSEQVTVSVDEVDSSILTEIPNFDGMDYVGVYTNGKLQRVLFMRNVEVQVTLILEDIRPVNQGEMPDISSPTAAPVTPYIEDFEFVKSNRRIYVERTNVQRIPAEYISSDLVTDNELQGKEQEPFYNLLSLYTQVDLYNRPRATEVIREIGISRVDEKDLIADELTVGN